MTLRAQIAGAVDVLALHRHAPSRYPFLLESVAGHPLAGRYDLLFAFPGEAQQLTSDTRHTDFFSTLSTRYQQLAQDEQAPEWPFIGGWFLYLGYEAVANIESRLHLPRSPYALPDALAVRCTAAVIVDRQLGCTYLIAESDATQLQQLKLDLQTLASQAEVQGPDSLISALSEDDPNLFLNGVASVHHYLKAGDVFQVNLSRAWQATLKPEVRYTDVYARLRESNPAPFAGLMRWGNSAVLSSSPERLVQSDGHLVQTRPIAGTRARHHDRALDAQGVQQLLANIKERAEHVMLIDLERNDLGKVCEAGSIRVSELMSTESYAHVHHIVSNVTGRLRAGVLPGDVIKAVFPGGTITGCPKIRAMEIIAELEGVGRGPYTGAMGYLSRDGKLDMNILIRTMVCAEGQVHFRAGAGIVADSNAASELAETRAKARGLLLALQP